MSQNNSNPQKCVFIGKKYYFCEGKYSINPKCVGLPISLTILIYNFIHISYLMNKIINNTTICVFLLIINILLFSLQLFQTLKTALTDPGSFLPNFGEDKSNSSDAKLMIATINNQDYFLKFCRTCLNAKDLRVYHCPDCGLCIIRHDHHCPWLSNCIGLNNHKYFIILVLINLFYFIYTIILLTNLAFASINKDKFEELSNAQKGFLYFLVCLNGVLFLFHLALLINHSIYIFTGQTTSERIRRKKGATNPFTHNNIVKNFIEFWKYPMKYRERIEYNDKASKFLDTNILICDYMSGNYYLSPEKKVISQTFINKGFSYNKTTIELIEKSNYSNSNEETSDSLKLDDPENNGSDNINAIN